MIDLLFASGNQGKLREVRKIFEGTKFNIRSLSEFENVPDIIEDGDTFEVNAFIKANTIYKLFGIPTIADDSGLAVDALSGEPGVHSARYAGENCTYEDNNKKLLEELSSVHAHHSAKFICCAVYIDDINKKAVEGILKGEIISEFKGQNGFGYDPLFLPEGYDKTLAEMTIDEKNKMSHRSKAFNNLKDEIIKLK